MSGAVDSTRLAPRVSRAFPRSRSRFVRPTSAIEPSCNEHPRCVWLTAASTSLWLALHRPVLRRVFADESRVSRRPTRFDDFVRSSWGVVFTTWTRKKTSLAPLSPHQGSVDRFTRDDLLVRPRSQRARPLVKDGKACVIRSAFPRSNRRSDAPLGA